MFQPNRYNRMNVLSPEYRDAFVDADVVVLTEIYPSGTTPIPGVTGKLVVNAVLDAHPETRMVWLPRREDLVDWLARELRPGDVSISMGCGDVASLPDEVLARRAELRSAGTMSVAEALARLDGFAVADEPLAPRTTYKVGGAAAVFATPRTLDELRAVSVVAADTGLPVVVIGRGSNMLVADAGVHGIVVSLAELCDDVAIDGTDVTAGSAVPLPVLARRTVAAGLTGFEWAVGVPGTIGGALRTNAGGHGSDMVACTTGVRLFDLRDGTVEAVSATALGLRFRGSDLADHHVVLDARLGLARGDVQSGEALLAEVVRWRREHQPGGQNAGSVFINPMPGELAAAELIDRLGLRGTRIGGASVSDKHANFIQASEGATAADVRAVMELVRSRVADETGIVLRSEVRLIGFADAEVCP